MLEVFIWELELEAGCEKHFGKKRKFNYKHTNGSHFEKNIMRKQWLRKD